MCPSAPLPRNFYPHPPRGGRPAPAASGSRSSRYFYPHPPRGGRPSFSMLPALAKMSFLPTPSARRATLRRPGVQLGLGISTHTLREEGDGQGGNVDFLFQISTHTLREEGDSNPPQMPNSQPNFYPHPPRGGRQAPACTWLTCTLFLPTPSARRATPADMAGLMRTVLISTHTLREEGDPLSGIFSPHLGYFYPHPPRGGRPFPAHLVAFQLLISTHTLREEGDSGSRSQSISCFNFYPHPPRGGRRGAGG